MAAWAKSDVRHLLDSQPQGPRRVTAGSLCWFPPLSPPRGAPLGGQGRHRASSGHPGPGLHLTGSPRGRGAGSGWGVPGGGSLPPFPRRRDLPTPLPGRGPAPGPGPGPDRDLGPDAPRLHPPPPSGCVPMATAPLRATFKGEVYTHAHAPSRRQLRIPQPFHQRGRPPTTGFLADCEVSAPPRRPAAGPAPGIPAPGPRSLPRTRVPVPRRVPELRRSIAPAARRPPPPGLQAEPYFGRWRRGPGQPCPEGRLFWAGQPEQLRPQGFPAGCAPGTEGTLGQGSLPSPPPHLPPRPRPAPSSILARPRSFPRPGTFSGARSLTECPEPVATVLPHQCPPRRCWRLSLSAPLLPSLGLGWSSQHPVLA